MSPIKENSRFCVRVVRVSGPAVLYCRDLDIARSFARRLSRIFNQRLEVYVTSVYYG